MFTYQWPEKNPLQRRYHNSVNRTAVATWHGNALSANVFSKYSAYRFTHMRGTVRCANRLCAFKKQCTSGDTFSGVARRVCRCVGV